LYSLPKIDLKKIATNEEKMIEGRGAGQKPDLCECS
jgi:hypothetical protein